MLVLVPPPGERVAVGPRVILRRPRESDRQAWSELVNASRGFLERWIPVPSIEEDPEATTWFDRTLATVGDERFEKLLVVHRERDALIGGLNFNEIVRRSFQSAYIGCWIGAEHARRGLMTEAIEL